MKYLLLFGFAVSFAGANCSTPNGLNRSCPGSTVQSLSYSVVQGCPADDGIITVSVGTAGSCTLGVIEPTGVALPTVGSFNDLASQTDYQLQKGNWNLENPTNGIIQAGTFYQCTAGAASANGDIVLGCNIESCGYQGDDDDVTCQTGGTCTAHLSPYVGDGGAPGPVTPTDSGVDGGAKNNEAGVASDAGS